MVMNRVNKISDIIQKKLKEELVREKISHISDVLEYKYSLHCECEISKEEYVITIEDEGISINQAYDIDELIELDVNLEIRILRRAFCMCIGNDEFKKYEEHSKGN
ncbi:hypothetical protein G9F72_024045 [Clostridium estertheticum]|uniref:hypothetical protein n=1 Tax=Clostridium estertheticum TaxID=238834 RepID=UPI0013E93310|nr:hypothetical protein [Clostridium estertheticum]MBZ9689373.1 hypothetical protein [Clostridium estertheticum]